MTDLNKKSLTLDGISLQLLEVYLSVSGKRTNVISEYYMLLNIATISKPESISISPVSLVIFFFNMATLLSGSNDAYVEKKNL